jgi:hypothetical protein
MIELDIKIRAKDEETFLSFIEMMTKSIELANDSGAIDVTLYVEKEDSRITITR